MARDEKERPGGRGLRFEPEREGLEAMMGPLEARIMEVVWELGEATIRDVWERLTAREEIAYTTVMTVVHRLFEKGHLLRETQGKRRHLYRPGASRAEFKEGILSRVLRGVARQLRGHDAVGLVGDLSREDRELLRRLLDEEE